MYMVLQVLLLTSKTTAKCHYSYSKTCFHIFAHHHACRLTSLLLLTRNCPAPKTWSRNPRIPICLSSFLPPASASHDAITASLRPGRGPLAAYDLHELSINAVRRSPTLSYWLSGPFPEDCHIQSRRSKGGAVGSRLQVAARGCLKRLPHHPVLAADSLFWPLSCMPTSPFLRGSFHINLLVSYGIHSSVFGRTLNLDLN